MKKLKKKSLQEILIKYGIETSGYWGSALFEKMSKEDKKIVNGHLDQAIAEIQAWVVRCLPKKQHQTSMPEDFGMGEKFEWYNMAISEAEKKLKGEK